MQWTYERGTGIRLLKGAVEETLRARAAIAKMSVSGHPHARTTAGRLEQQLQAEFITEEVVQSLLRWYDSEGTYSSGVEPAREVSRALYLTGRCSRDWSGPGVSTSERVKPASC